MGITPGQALLKIWIAYRAVEARQEIGWELSMSPPSRISPERVLAAARDFSERRADRWPDVHVEYLHVHELGETFAEVTEGNPSEVGFMWERLRYDWSQPGSVKATVVDSNVFHPGSTWELRARPSNGGSLVEIIGIVTPRV
jgi:hypothetical protein